MSPRRWLRVAVWTAATAAALPCAGPIAFPAAGSYAALAQNAPAVPLADPTPALERAEVDRLLAGLRQRNAPPAEREEAARRLLRRTAPDVRPRVTEAVRLLLRSADDRDGRLAAARAIAADPNPDPAFIDDLAAMLGPDRIITPAATQALSAYKGNREVFNTLDRFARTGPSTPTRVAAIRAMGRFVEKYTAQALVQLLSDTVPGVRNAAFEALLEMTALAENDRDVRRWQQWMAAGAGQTEEQWKAGLLAARSARQDRDREQYAELRREMEARLKDLVQATPADQRERLVMSLLNSASPDVRAYGAGLVAQLVNEAVRIGDELKNRLVQMVGDGSPRVRLAATAALGAVIYERALDALLVQLAVEPEAQVRSAIAGVLARMPGTRQVPALLARLDDPSPEVREAAAGAIQQLGPEIVKDPALAGATAERLLAAIRQPGVLVSPANDDALRAAYGRALVPLVPPDELSDQARQMLGDNRPAVRRVGLQLLGQVTEPRLVPQSLLQIREALIRERVPAAREQALLSLGQIAGPAQQATFLDYMRPPRETIPSVQDAAWQGLQSVMRKMTPEQLADLAQTLRRDEAERLIVVEEFLAERLREAGRLDEWAQQKINAAGTAMKLRPPQPDRAAQHYRDALNHFRKIGHDVFKEQALIGNLVEALLANRQYDEAVKLAADTIREAQQGPPVGRVGSAIYTAVQQLAGRNDSQSLLDAQRLIRLALEMEPPLHPLHRGYIQGYRDKVDERLRQRGGGTTGRQ